MVGYIRVSAGSIVTGATIQASHFNNEYNAIQAFADSSTGHNHDGTTGGGAKIPPAGFTGVTSTSSGFIAADGANSLNPRTLTAPAAGLTISNPAGVAGNPTFALANDLAGVEGLATNGIAVRTATDTWTTRAVTAGTNITVTNGDGVAGAPTIALSSSYTGQSTITTVGTITSGTWSGAFGAVSGANLTGLTAANISAGTAGISVTGNAGTATALQTARNINGTSFNGTADITVTAAAGTLTGTTLNATVVSSSLTSVGTLATGTWNAGVISGQYGGTGVANTGKTITIGGNFTTSGAFTTTLTATANTAVTLPTTGTLATLAGTETLTNKTLTNPTITLAQSTTPAPTAEGDIQWDTDGDFIVVGDGSGQKIFYPALPGSFTPTIAGTTLAGTGTYTANRTGRYTRHADRYDFNIRCEWTAHTGTGNMTLTGMPFTAALSTPVQIIGTNLVSPAGTIVVALASGNQITFFSMTPATGATAALAIDPTADIFIQGTVFI